MFFSAQSVSRPAPVVGETIPPVSLWSPSRDDAGNGTATLNQLESGNDGTLTNMDPATDWVDDTDNGGTRALQFDGSNEYVTIPYDSNVPLTGDFSVGIWYKKLSNDRAILFDKPHTSHTGLLYNIELRIDPNGRIIMFVVVDNAASDLIIYEIPVAQRLNRWHHIMIVRDQDATRLYFDGAKVGEKAYAGQIADSQTDWRLGAYGNLTSGDLDGLLDEFRIYDQALNDAQVAQLSTARNAVI